MTVKPLVWTETVGGQRYALSPFRSDYWIKQYPACHPFRAGKWEASCLATNAWLQSFHDDPQAAMDACQSHLEGVIAGLYE